MTFKFWKIAKVKKGNKKTFESNLLTEAIAEKVAKKDMKTQKQKQLQGV